MLGNASFVPKEREKKKLYHVLEFLFCGSNRMLFFFRNSE
jgi:hypothetical protein